MFDCDCVWSFSLTLALSQRERELFSQEVSCTCTRTASSQQRLRFRLSGGTPCGRVQPGQPGEGRGAGRCWPLSRAPSSGGGAMAWPVRYRVIGLLFCSAVVNYVDRLHISVAAPRIMRETGWDKGRFGLVFSTFLIGYALLQIPGGVIADRWSARKVLALSFCGFSLFTALTPLGQHAFFLLLALRFLVGAFESVTFPALTSLNSRWIPRPEFGRAQTFSVSGITVGQMVAYPLTTWIVLHFSWPVVFYVNAVLGFVWAAAWLRYATDTPSEHPDISQEE